MTKLTSTRRRSVRPGFRWRWLSLSPPALLALWIGYVFATDNFHVVSPGEAYRAGQMNSNQLVRCIQRHGIRSVVNLRGAHPGRPWYQAEVLAASSQNVIHRSIALSSRKTASPEQMSELIAMLKSAPKPVLLHCDGGADRASLAAAVYVVEVAKAPPKEAEREFSIWYGYLPFIWKKKAHLRESFRAYIMSQSPDHQIAAEQRKPGT